MTMTNASPAARGRRIKFTPQVIEQIKEFVAAGISRDEIANRIGVTVGSLQVTCSRLGISLRRIIQTNGSGRHTLDVNGRTIPTPCSGIAHVREQKTEEAGSAKIAIMMRRRGKEVSTDVPLTSRAIGELALIAMLRDLSAAELLGQTLAAAIKKDMIQEILSDEVPSSAT